MNTLLSVLALGCWLGFGAACVGAVAWIERRERREMFGKGHISAVGGMVCDVVYDWQRDGL